MSIQDIQASLNKKFKGELLTIGEDYPKLDRIKFSSPRLNYLTRGGIPWPGVTEISGPEQSGKTTLLGDLTKNAQAMGIICSFTDTENKTDLDYWKWLGVNVDDLLVCKPAGVSGEDILQLQLDMLDEGVGFLGLDSVASLVPKQVLTGSMDDKTYCGSSGIMSTFSQKLSGTGILIAKKAALVGINQVRDKLSGFGLQTPAGHFWRHICLLRLQISRGNPFDAIYREMPMNTTEDTAGYKMEVKLLKNQICKNDRRFNYCTFNYSKGIDVLEDLIDVAIDLDIINQSGAWYRFVNKETGEILCVNNEEIKFQGKGNVREYLENNNRIAMWVAMQVDKYIAED